MPVAYCNLGDGLNAGECPSVWTERRARDSWQYMAYPVTAADGALPAEGSQVVERYLDRFMTGADTLWPVEQLHPWDEPDAGRQRLEQCLACHRAWVGRLPREVAGKVRLTNALQFFDSDGR